MNFVYNFFGGKSTCFALAFFVVGAILAFRHQLNGDYVALAGGIQTLVATRSIADDYHQRETAKIKNGNHQ